MCLNLLYVIFLSKITYLFKMALYKYVKYVIYNLCYRRNVYNVFYNVVSSIILNTNNLIFLLGSNLLQI